MTKLKLENYFSTSLQNGIDDSISWEIELQLWKEPQSDFGFLLVDYETNDKEEIFYHRKSWTSIFTYGVNRTNPKTHDISSSVLLNDSASVFNYITQLLPDHFFIYKTSETTCHIKWGKVFNDWEYKTITDKTDIILVAGTNYLYIEWTSILSTTTALTDKFMIGEIVVDWLLKITSFETYNTIWLTGKQGIQWNPWADSTVPWSQWDPWINGTNWTDGVDWINGNSAYQVWINNWNVWTEAEYLTSLEGSDWVDGTNWTNWTNWIDGTNWTNGTNGLDWKTVLNGTVDPTTEWVDGDFYINTTTNFIFWPKAWWSWPAWVDLTWPAWQAGSGTWDMLASNNLSDVADAATARTNLWVSASGTEWTNIKTITIKENVNAGQCVWFKEGADGDYIIYSNIDSTPARRLYKKSSSDSTDWTAITWQDSRNLTISPDWEFIWYHNYQWGTNYLYRKNADDTANGTQMVTGWSVPDYSPSWTEIVYILDASWRIKKKDSTDSSGWSDINSEISATPIWSPDGNSIVYRRNSDNYLCKKSSTDTANWSAITSVSSYEPNYSPDWTYIVYRNVSDNNYLYRKSATDTSNWTAINSVSSRTPFYSPDGNYIVYINSDDGGKLYRKSATDSTNWSAINTVNGYYGAYTLWDWVDGYYKTNASASTTASFAWITTNSAVADATVNITTSWISGDIAWLVDGTEYYLSDSVAGWLSTTAWTVEVKVGKAVNNSELLIYTGGRWVDNDTTYTDAEIKTKYENNSDTNVFTDTEKTKLIWIEEGAEVNEVTLDWVEVLTNKTLTNYTNEINAKRVIGRVKAADFALDKWVPITLSQYNEVDWVFEAVVTNQSTMVANAITSEAIALWEQWEVVMNWAIMWLNTENYTEWQILYVNGWVLTSVEPTTWYSQPIAVVARDHLTEWVIQVLAAYPKQDSDDVRTSTTNFNNNLSWADDTVQKALDTLDNLASWAAKPVVTAGEDLSPWDTVAYVLEDFTESYWTDSAFNDSSSEYMSATEIDTNTVFIVYRDFGNSNKWTWIVATITGWNTIGYWNPITFTIGELTWVSAVTKISTGIAFIAYKDTNDYDWHWIVVDATWANIVYWTQKIFNPAWADYISVDLVSTNKVLIAYEDGGNSSYGTAVVWDISWTDVVFWNEYAFYNATTNYTTVTKIDTDKAFIWFESANGRAVVASVVNWNELTFWAVETKNIGDTNYQSSVLIDTNKIFLVYQDWDNSYYLTWVIVTITWTAIAFWTEVVLDETNSHHISIEKLSTNKAFILYDDDTNTKWVGLIADVNWTVIEPWTPNQFNTGAIYYTSATLIDTNKVFLAYSDWGNWSYWTWNLFTWTDVAAWYYKTDASNSDKINFTWFADTTVTSWNTFDLNTTLDNNQTSLETGEEYYLSDWFSTYDENSPAWTYSNYSLYNWWTTQTWQALTIDSSWLNLKYVDLNLDIDAWSPTWDATIKIYASTWTVWTDAVPTGSVLATSEWVDVTTLPADTSSTITRTRFTFTTPYSLTASTDYCFVVEYTWWDWSNRVWENHKSWWSTHNWNFFRFASSTYTADNERDMVFKLLENSEGWIQTTAWTTSIKIGKAISSTEIEIYTGGEEEVVIPETTPWIRTEIDSQTLSWVTSYDTGILSTTYDNYKMYVDFTNFSWANEFFLTFNNDTSTAAYYIREEYWTSTASSNTTNWARLANITNTSWELWGEMIIRWTNSRITYRCDIINAQGSTERQWVAWMVILWSAISSIKMYTSTSATFNWKVKVFWMNF